MSNEEPWLDPDFEDPTPVGDDGWPDPPLDLDAPPSHDLDELDALIPPIPVATASQTAPERPRTASRPIGRPKTAEAVTNELVVSGVASVATAAIVWGLVALPLHSLVSWAVALIAGGLTFWVFHTTTQTKGLIAAGGMVAVAFLFWLAPALALLAALVAIAWVVFDDLEL